jgi:uncharacterized membrane protein YeaQ/YmgE (transglycosylase-associated protein family)
MALRSVRAQRRACLPACLRLLAHWLRSVVCSSLGFISLPPLGLIPSTFAAFMISIFGSTEFRWVESLIAAVVMTAFCVVLFVYLLQLPFQLWPWY